MMDHYEFVYIEKKCIHLFFIMVAVMVYHFRRLAKKKLENRPIEYCLKLI